MQFHKPRDADKEPVPVLTRHVPATGSNAGASAAAATEGASTLPVGASPQSIMLQIRELDHKMTGYREERNVRSLQILGDKKELAFVNAQIARLEQDCSKTATTLATREDKMSSMSGVVTDSSAGEKEVIALTKQLLQQSSKQSAKIQQQQDRFNAQRKPDRVISRDAEMFLSRERLGSK